LENRSPALAQEDRRRGERLLCPRLLGHKNILFSGQFPKFSPLNVEKVYDLGEYLFAGLPT
jgi:hypothetical protein